MNFRACLVLCLAAACCARGQSIETELEVRILQTADTRVNRQAIRRDAIPGVSVGIEATGPAPSYVGLEADGLLMDFAENTKGASPYRATLRWWPWHGNGRYALAARAQDWSMPTVSVTSHVLHAELEGLYYRTPSPLDQVIRLYRERFGLRITKPPLARFVAKDPAKSCWVSAVYVDDTLYELRLYDDLHNVSRARPVNRRDERNAEKPVTRPAGRYSLLVVFLDHGNTDISESDARRTLTRAAAEANERIQAMSSRVRAKDPLLTLEVSSAFGPWPGGTNVVLIEPGQIFKITRKDPAPYQLVVQVDLDSRSPAGGHALRGYDGQPASGINVWARAPRLDDLEDVLSRIVLGHELNHTFGWEHEWPCGVGTFDDNRPGIDPLDAPIPALLFGWLDLDDDDIPEILDLTPCGLTR